MSIIMNPASSTKLTSSCDNTTWCRLKIPMYIYEPLSYVGSRLSLRQNIHFYVLQKPEEAVICCTKDQSRYVYSGLKGQAYFRLYF